MGRQLLFGVWLGKKKDKEKKEGKKKNEKNSFSFSRSFFSFSLFFLYIAGRKKAKGKRKIISLVVAVAPRRPVRPVELQQKVPPADFRVGDAAGARDRSRRGRVLSLAPSSPSDVPGGAVSPGALVGVLLAVTVEPGRELRVGRGLGDLEFFLEFFFPETCDKVSERSRLFLRQTPCRTSSMARAGSSSRGRAGRLFRS